MQIDTQRHVTKDGYPYRVLAEDLPGDLPVAIHSNGAIRQLRADLSCPADDGYSLVQGDRNLTRYFNVYRAADGGFCMGSRSFDSNEARLRTFDSQRALFGLKVTYNENSGAVTAERAN